MPPILFYPTWVRHGGGWIAGQLYLRRGGKWVTGDVYVRTNGKWVRASPETPF